MSLYFELETLAKEAHREVRLRQRVYPRLVQQKKLTQAKADEQIAKMAQIAAYLDAQAADHTPKLPF